MMTLARKMVAVAALLVAVSPLASAGCSGYVVQTGCGRCGFLWLDKYSWKRVTYYTNNPDGTCNTSSATQASDCGSC